MAEQLGPGDELDLYTRKHTHTHSRSSPACNATKEIQHNALLISEEVGDKDKHASGFISS